MLVFPKIKEEEAIGFIALNMTANILGLGNIATPFGLNAMKKLQESNKDKESLSDEMMMLIIINTASIQIIPTSIIALRATYNSNSPVIVVIPILIASFVSVILGIILVKIKCWKELRSLEKNRIHFVRNNSNNDSYDFSYRNKERKRVV